MRWLPFRLATILKLAFFLITNCNFVFAQRWGPKPSTCLSLIKSLSGSVRDDEGWFKVEIENEPKFYVPFERYTVVLRSQHENHKFKEFNLVVESADNTSNRVGKFQRFVEALTKFSDECPNGLVQSSALPKSEIRVMWVAPASGAGCVRFRATVRWKEEWYGNSESLSYSLCEESHGLDGQPPLLRHCGACDEAKYELTFTGLWSRNTHPKHFPPNAWDASISEIVGASHSPAFRLFTQGSPASEQLKRLAEDGNTKMLSTSLNNHTNAPHIRTIIKARGLSNPNLTGETYAVFRVDPRHHLMSLVAKLSPSPDWFLGVDSLELCLANGSWIEEKQLNVYLWDAGTDAGTTYRNPQRLPLQPPHGVRQISSQYPAVDSSPFFNINQTKIKPFARIRVHRQQVYTGNSACAEAAMKAQLRLNAAVGEEEEADPLGPAAVGPEYEESEGGAYKGGYNQNDYNPNGGENQEQLQQPKASEESLENDQSNMMPISVTQTGALQDDCGTTDWSEWSPCESDSQTICGPGKRQRTRHLIKAHKLGECAYRTVLIERELCVTPCAERRVQATNEHSPEHQQNAIDSQSINNEATWKQTIAQPSFSDANLNSLNSPSTSSKGTAANNDAFQSKSELAGSAREREVYEPDADRYPIPNSCRVGSWSEWSSCFGDCSLDSYANRTRTLLTFKPECLHVPLVQQRVCDQGCQPPGQSKTVEQTIRTKNRRPTGGRTYRAEVNKTELVSSTICNQPVGRDDCGIKQIRYYFDSQTERCRRFIYRGCPDLGNRFNNLKECESNCLVKNWKTDWQSHLLMERLTMSASEQEKGNSKNDDSSSTQFNEPIYQSITAESHTQIKQHTTESHSNDDKKPKKSEEWTIGNRCATTEWSEWSQCFNCTGHRYRFRKLQYSKQYTRCQIKLVDQEECSNVAKCRTTI